MLFLCCSAVCCTDLEIPAPFCRQITSRKLRLLWYDGLAGDGSLFVDSRRRMSAGSPAYARHAKCAAVQAGV